MSTLAATNLTLIDHAKLHDPDGKPAKIVEILNQTNEILLDAVFIPGNLPGGHQSTIRTGLPEVYWRSVNAGVPPSKSTTAQVTDTCGMLEAYSNVDVVIADLNGNTPEFRFNEDRAFLEAMNQEQAEAMFYADPAVDPKKYLGLSKRYGLLSAGNGKNILDAGGTSTDNTSIWLVIWSEQTVHCTFPKGLVAGLEHKDLGERTVRDASQNDFQAYSTHYRWVNGLVVKDWRYIVRIANIDVSSLTSESGAADVIKFMIKAMGLIPNFGMGKAAFYMNRTVHTMLMIQALGKSQQVLSIKEATSQFGTPMSYGTFLGIPLRKVDAILNTEARVV